MPAVKHLGAQDLLRLVYLAVLQRALISAGKELRAVVARELTQVVIEVTGLVEVGCHQQIWRLLLRQLHNQCRQHAPREALYKRGAARAGCRHQSLHGRGAGSRLS